MVTVVSILVLFLALISVFARPLRSALRGNEPFRFLDLWRWSGAVSRRRYAIVGIVGFAIKHNIDRIVATAFFNRRFTPWNYWSVPVDALRIDLLAPADRRFIVTMAAISLPFVWLG